MVNAKKGRCPLTVQITIASDLSASEKGGRRETLQNALFEGAIQYLGQRPSSDKKVAQRAKYAKIQA